MTVCRNRDVNKERIAVEPSKVESREYPMEMKVGPSSVTRECMVGREAGVQRPYEIGDSSRAPGVRAHGSSQYC